MTDEAIARAIAEKVMGWVIHHRNTAHWVRADYEASGDFYRKADVGGMDGWNPLRCDKDACKVLDRMAELGWSGGVWYSDFKEPPRCQAEFVEANKPYPPTVHDVPVSDGDFGAARRRALCLSALKALGAEVLA